MSKVYSNIRLFSQTILRVAACLAFGLFIFTVAASAATIIVNTATDTNANNGLCTLREAIANANANSQVGSTDCAAGSGADTINFNASLANQTILLTPALGQLSITSSMTIDALAVANVSVSGGGATRVFNITPASSIVVMTGFRITGGSTSLSGGAITNFGNLTLNNMVIQGNTATASLGGGISTGGNSLTINGGSILDNSANQGGGIYGSSGSINLTNVTVSGNTSVSDSGGIFTVDGTLNITGGSVTGNTANGFGGGILTTGTTVTVTNASITNNQANGSTGNGGGMYIAGGSSTITNSTVSRNRVSGYGGGIYNSGTTTLMNSIVSGNTVGSGFISGLGGGIYNQGTLTLNNTTVSGNAATNDNGGGIYNNSSGTLTLTNSTVSENRTAASGGGIYNNSSGITTLTNSTVSGNRAQFFGGGIYTSNNRTTTLTNSTVSVNIASQGAGIYISNNSTMTLTNSTVSGNTGTNGGGIYNDGILNLTSVTVAYNSGDNVGGGVYNNGGTTNLSNTIVANNTGSFSPDFHGAINSTSSFNLIGNGTGMSGITGGVNGNQVGVDPKLDSALALNGGVTLNHALLFGSPALDTGNATGTDQRGFLRPVDLPSVSNGTGNAADIGAYEAQTAPAGPTAANVSVSGRVFADGGRRGLTNATVVMTDLHGTRRTARTSAFGYFRFNEVEVGQTYILSVKSKRYSFAPQVITVNEDLTQLNFTPQ